MLQNAYTHSKTFFTFSVCVIFLPMKRKCFSPCLKCAPVIACDQPLQPSQRETAMQEKRGKKCNAAELNFTCRVTTYYSSRVRSYYSSRVSGYFSSRVTGHYSSRVTGYYSSRVPGYYSSRVTGSYSSRVTG